MTRRYFFLTLIFLIIGLNGGILLFWPGYKKTWTQVDVMAGTSAHGVLDQLIEKQHLRFRFPFLVWTKLRGAETKIKIGRYHFSSGRSAYWIVNDLIEGRTQKIRVTIPEGFASWQIADRMEENLICGAKELLVEIQEKDLEGFLMPATYDLDLGLNAETVARVLKEEFDRRWPMEWTRRADAMGWTQKMVVTLASILEREAMVREELPMVSSLYHNRLKKNMPLEADPTVQYAMGYWKSRLLFSDYRNIKSPYNTYLHAGLPPGPICSPGSVAVEAALFPAESDFIYMVSKGDGTHDFSKTYREHVNKVNRRNRQRRRARP